MSDEDKSHKWLLTNLTKAFTCEKCGLLKLVTLNGNFYFVRFSDPYLQCNQPYKCEPVDVEDAERK